MLDRQAEMIRGVMEQREEILAAFIAKYGFAPDECQQVTYGNSWQVVRLEPEQVKLIRKGIIMGRLHHEKPTVWQAICLRLMGL